MTKEEFMIAYMRYRHPRLRRKTIVGLIHNGGNRRIYGCAFCHATHSECSRYPRAKHTSEFIKDHNIKHYEEICEEVREDEFFGTAAILNEADECN